MTKAREIKLTCNEHVRECVCPTLQLTALKWTYITVAVCTDTTKRDTELKRAVERLRRLDVVLSTENTGFDYCPVHVRFTVDKVALGQIFLGVLQLSQLVSSHPRSIVTLRRYVPLRHNWDEKKKQRISSRRHNHLPATEVSGPTSTLQLLAILYQRLCMEGASQTILIFWLWNISRK